MTNKDLQNKLLTLVQELKKYDDNTPAFVSTDDNCGGYVDVIFDEIEITTNSEQVFVMFN